LRAGAIREIRVPPTGSLVISVPVGALILATTGDFHTVARSATVAPAAA